VKKLDMTRSALRFISGLDAKQYKQVVQRIFALADDSRPHDSIKMEGSPYFRVTQGEYRIVYDFDEETVRILVIGKRNDDEVYKRASRLKG
jgi:mRNA interferase RelE/StbE